MPGDLIADDRATGGEHTDSANASSSDHRNFNSGASDSSLAVPALENSNSTDVIGSAG